MAEKRRHFLVQLRSRDDTRYVSQSRTMLATGRDGFVTGGPDHGLFVHQTRLLSRYRYLIDGRPPRPVALSNVEQHSWLGYYIQLPPGLDAGEPDHGSGQVAAVSQQTLELRLSRYVGAGGPQGGGLTKLTPQPTAFRLELEVAADFADQSETRGARQQQGVLTSAWRAAGEGTW